MSSELLIVAVLDYGPTDHSSVNAEPERGIQQLMSVNQLSKVLVVEDEFLIRMTLTEALSDEGFEVLEAETADAALPMLIADPSIRLLLTDIQLPGVLNGRTLAQQVRARRPTLPVIYMTGQADPGDVASSLDVFISKPYTLHDICDAARRLTTSS
jgi:CheY-like chemotaxis protein